MAFLRRAILFWLVMALAAIGSTTPAAAHTGQGLSSSNYLSTIKGIEPAAPGVSIRLIEARSKVELKVTSDSEVVVFGYGREPYLKVSTEGAFENKLSPSVTLNQSSASRDTPVPTQIEPPQWQKLSNDPILRWYDKRANYDNSNVPQEGIPHWDIPIKVGNDQAAIIGSVEAVPAPNPLPKYLLSVALAVLVAAMLFTPWWRATLTTALVALVVIDIEHSLVIALRKEGLGAVIGDLAAGFYAIAGWAMAGAAIAYLFRKSTSRHEEVYFFAIFAALVMGFVAGFADIADINHSQLPVVGPPELTRWSITLSIGLGVGVVIGCIGRLVKSRRALRAEE